MTAKEINDKLIALYTKHLCKFPKDEIEKSFGTDDYSNPLLIHCWEDYTKDYIRILYIGRETSSWYSGDDCTDEQGYYNIEKLVDLVVNKFDFKFKKKYRFFSLLYKLEKKFNNIENELGKSPKVHNFLWTNVFKFGRYDEGKRRPIKKVQDWEQNYLNILRNEIEITKPDLIIFVTGNGVNDDEYYIKRVLGKFQIYNINGQKDIVEVKSEGINIPMYRVPRPERFKHDTIVDILVKHYNQKYEGNI